VVEAEERRLYALLHERLPRTALLSVGHHSRFRPVHAYHWALFANGSSTGPALDFVPNQESTELREGGLLLLNDVAVAELEGLSRVSRPRSEPWRESGGRWGANRNDWVWLLRIRR